MGLGKTITVLALVVADRTAELEEEEGSRALGQGAEEDDCADLIRGLENLNLASSSSSPPPLDYFKTHRSQGPTLIVCPLSVLQNWRKQIQTHTNDRLKVLVFHGPMRTKDPELLKEQDIVLSTYPVLASEFSRQARGEQASVLHSFQWRRVVLDEGHVICNPKAKQSRAVLQLNAERRWVVTGTPLQNKLDDLYSLFAFLQIYPFKGFDIHRVLQDFEWFRCLISDPARSKVASRREQGLSIVRSILGTYCLRRSKTQKIGGKPILQLPKKQEIVRHLELSEEEQEIYDALFQSGKAMLRTYIKEGTVMSHYTKILERLVRLRQLCCHKQLLPATELNPSNLSASDIAEECCVCLEPIERAVITKCAHIFCKGCLAREGGEEGVYMSTKLKAILSEIEQLRETAPGDKVVIFSQFTSFLDIIESSLVPGTFAKLDGRLTRAKRDHVIESFQNDQQLQILLISMKAGGTGLNLVVANHVFITDLWWNSAVEKQASSSSPPCTLLHSFAMDRVYRLGQTKDVRVVKFVITGTIEERILELQHKKEQLIAGAMSVSSKGELQRVRTQDLNFLFR
ncbi:hypothetical protein GUITHDRAFT_70888 [Guillardia theta CCMP2712]|uniref:Uncharacterized protein n=1 Tax=Guillardia theta (strain CCMP2712) TaxID=905079 RepID=L1JD72_GUITC|nr:hypothetical protein GUITHDRAFT_70888 [Guillardia theta CCMP2712]EKX46055.1 hypothetical protein GUITHDRAFT_70888 [Guillardia theta CCMP2712]|eukprot:XP_005833035.1 hypothetical protein GUITHDRAFT_70888 [Guillardia theta CCMP2712]